MATPIAYRVKRQRAINGTIYAEPGETVHELRVCDYGCAADDTMFLHAHHVSVTKDPAGGYPFFTIPFADLERAES